LFTCECETELYDGVLQKQLDSLASKPYILNSHNCCCLFKYWFNASYNKL